MAKKKEIRLLCDKEEKKFWLKIGSDIFTLLYAPLTFEQVMELEPETLWNHSKEMQSKWGKPYFLLRIDSREEVWTLEV